MRIQDWAGDGLTTLTRSLLLWPLFYFSSSTIPQHSISFTSERPSAKSLSSSIVSRMSTEFLRPRRLTNGSQMSALSYGLPASPSFLLVSALAVQCIHGNRPQLFQRSSLAVFFLSSSSSTKAMPILNTLRFLSSSSATAALSAWWHVPLSQP